MRWAEAVKIWNTHKKSVNASHVYCLPKKGTPEHAHVKHIQMGGHPEEFKQGPVSSKKFLLKAFRERQEAAEKRVAARKIEAAAAPKAPAEKMETPKKFVFKKKAEREAEAKRKEDAEVMAELKALDRSELLDIVKKHEPHKLSLPFMSKEQLIERIILGNYHIEGGSKKRAEMTDLKKLSRDELIDIIKRERPSVGDLSHLPDEDLRKWIHITGMPIEAPKKKYVFKTKAEREAEARVAETGKKLKGEKVKAFLKAALERRRAKKEVAKESDFDRRFELAKEVEEEALEMAREGKRSVSNIYVALKPKFDRIYSIHEEAGAGAGQEWWDEFSYELNEKLKKYTKGTEDYEVSKLRRPRPDLEKLTLKELETIYKNWALTTGRSTNIGTHDKERMIILINRYDIPIETKKSETLLETEALRRRIRAWAKGKGVSIPGLMKASLENLRKAVKEHSIP